MNGNATTASNGEEPLTQMPAAADEPAVMPDKEETGLGGNRRQEGMLHGFRGLLFLSFLAGIVIVTILMVTSVIT